MEIQKARLAELIGILLGDGSLGIYHSKVKGKTKTQWRIKVTLNSEKDLAYSFFVSDLFVSVFGQWPKRFKRKNEKTLDIYLLGQKPLAYLLGEGLILAPKWKRTKIPSQFMSNPYDRLVLRGYMDTDGCISVVNNNGIRYPRIEMKICPAPMQKQFILILKKNGFEPQINKLERGKVRIALSGIKKLRKWNDEIGFSNPRNALIAKSFLDQTSDTKQYYKAVLPK